ncbi:unnamed protein product, partial [Brugia timori]|uniref:Secreted protein n=1 Tax=Brugia timori TaxID=42155 RepID=A0A0R3QFG9_9BILA
MRSFFGFHVQMNTSLSCPFRYRTLSLLISYGRFSSCAVERIPLPLLTRGFKPSISIGVPLKSPLFAWAARNSAAAALALPINPFCDRSRDSLSRSRK